MRDRERRRSMTSEQRDRHLVRRRRNYQVRMQRVKHRDLVVQSGTSNAGINCMNHRRESVYDLKAALQFSYVAPVGSGRLLLKVHGDHSSSPKGTEPLAYDLAKLRRRFDNERKSSKLVHGVRLNHFKELAQGWKSVPKETCEQLPMSEAEGNLEERNLLPVEGHPPTPTDESITEVTVSL